MPTSSKVTYGPVQQISICEVSSTLVQWRRDFAAARRKASRARAEKRRGGRGGKKDAVKSAKTVNTVLDKLLQ